MEAHLPPFLFPPVVPRWNWDLVTRTAMRGAWSQGERVWLERRKSRSRVWGVNVFWKRCRVFVVWSGEHSIAVGYTDRLLPVDDRSRWTYAMKIPLFEFGSRTKDDDPLWTLAALIQVKSADLERVKDWGAINSFPRVCSSKLLAVNSTQRRTFLKRKKKEGCGMRLGSLGASFQLEVDQGNPEWRGSNGALESFLTFNVLACQCSPCRPYAYACIGV